MTCQCNAAGWCDAFKRTMSPRQVQICRDDASVLTPEKRAGLRANWAAIRDGTIRTRMQWPGSVMATLITRLDLGKVDCGGKCAKWLRKMNDWGPDGCVEHFDELVKHFRKMYSKLTWTEAMKARVLALTTGLVLQVNWLDPIPSLVQLAIEKARTP